MAKHVSEAGFNGRYPSIIATVVISLVILVILVVTEAYTFKKARE
ncbi:hypothetical protein PRVXH_000385 [Proteinivorax hydrogeniformans]|uniref:Uncharacterized protein n=1 Tax=Proteinivorax hydrogeniformans TaxID=1826727 RepID=A0AAU8HUQ3_9FIRM